MGGHLTYKINKKIIRKTDIPNAEQSMNVKKR